ncbi:MAG: hypothetical protein ACRCX8_15920 [Sarcina sp.]
MMKKEDIKNGMVVEFRNKERALVVEINGIKFLIKSNGATETTLDSVNSNFKNHKWSEKDINKLYIFEPAKGSSVLKTMESDSFVTLGWERIERTRKFVSFDEARRSGKNVRFDAKDDSDAYKEFGYILVKAGEKGRKEIDRLFTEDLWEIEGEN